MRSRLQHPERKYSSIGMIIIVKVYTGPNLKVVCCTTYIQTEKRITKERTCWYRWPRFRRSHFSRRPKDIARRCNETWRQGYDCSAKRGLTYIKILPLSLFFRLSLFCSSVYSVQFHLEFSSIRLISIEKKNPSWGLWSSLSTRVEWDLGADDGTNK